jgi:hypothetical protein
VPNPKPPPVATTYGNAVRRGVTCQRVADATMTVMNQTWVYEISQGFSYAATTVIDQT